MLLIKYQGYKQPIIFYSLLNSFQCMYTSTSRFAPMSTRYGSFTKFHDFTYGILCWICSNYNVFDWMPHNNYDGIFAILHRHMKVFVCVSIYAHQVAKDEICRRNGRGEKFTLRWYLNTSNKCLTFKNKEFFYLNCLA